MRNRWIQGAALAALFLAGGALAEDALPRIDLAAAVAVALERNPALLAVAEKEREVAAGIREARGEAFPELTLVSSWSRARNPSLLNSKDFEDFIENIPGGTFTPGENELWRLALEVRQPIYTAGKVGAALKLARLVAEATSADIASARLDTALAAATTYYRVLAARRSRATVEAQESVRKEALAVVQARYELGEATRLELLRVEAALAEVGPAIEEARGALLVAEQELRAVLGLPSGTALEVEEHPTVEPADPPLLAALLALATENRPELRALALRRDALLRQEQVALADGKPQVDLVGSYGREVRLLENLEDSLYQDWRVSLGFSWNFYDGGKRQGQAERLASQRRALELEERSLTLAIGLELERARTSYEAARARWRSASTAATSAREASRVARESYQEGVALLTDVLDAQQTEIEVELALVAAYYDALRSAVEIDRAVGRLPGNSMPARWGREETRP